MENEIQSYRDEINKLDKEIVEKISLRAKMAQKIAAAKAKDGSPIFRPDREKEVYRKILAINKGPLTNTQMKGVYREIMSSVIALEGGLSFCYLGPEASYTHQAGIKKFGTALKAISMDSIPEVFRAIETEKYRYGVVPIENSTEGMVTHTLDQFFISDLQIYSELYLQIHHSLLSDAKSLSDIKYIYSHRQPFAQCRDYLYKHLRNAELIETSSTSKAAEMAAGKSDSAAIASELASGIYNIAIMSTGIEDNPQNYTRFLIIGCDKCAPTGDDKTSIICSISDKSGALVKLLQPFYDASINMTRIESRADRLNKWQYNFFIDIVGHLEDEKVKKVLEEVSSITTMLKVLGSFPNGSKE